MSQPAAFDRRPWLILCEGETDKRFLDQLISNRALPDEFQIRFPSRGTDNRGGRSKFGPWLNAAQAVTGWSDIRAVLIISDNDDDPPTSFGEVRASLTAGKWPGIPSFERTIAKSPGYPHTVILMLPPAGQQGSLETLCLLAAYFKWQNIQAPLDAFVQSAGVNGWSANKEAKMRLQTVIAATCNARPDAGFAGHWREDVQYHIPLNHAVFNDLATFLRGFRGLIDLA
jgi:hypothetical protein